MTRLARAIGAKPEETATALWAFAQMFFVLAGLFVLRPVRDEMSIAGVSSGVVVSEVEDGSVAASLGIQKGDVVMAVNDAKIARTSDLRRATESRKAFWKLTLSRGGQVFTTVING